MGRIKLVCVVLLLFLLNPGYVFSDNWSIRGFVDQDLSYDDNVFMQVGNNRLSSFKYRIIPQISFQHQTDATNLSASASYGAQIYTDIPNFDQEIQNYSVNGLYKTELIDWGLNWNYSITPSRNNIQNNFLTNNNSDQNTWTVSPYLTYKVNPETDSITFSPSYTETEFSGGTGIANTNNNLFRNSTSYTFDLSWQHLWSPRYLSEFSFFYSNFESQIFDTEIAQLVPSSFDNFGINFTNTYQIAENWRFDATVGGRYTETDRGGIKDTNFGFLADLGVNYTAENYTGGLHFNRGLFPSSFGQLQEQTSVGLNFSYRVLESLTTRLNVSYLDSTFIGGSDNERFLFFNRGNRTFFTIEPSVNWQFARDWTLGGSYRYRLQDNQSTVVNGFTGEADSNLFMLSVNYNWQGINTSR